MWLVDKFDNLLSSVHKLMRYYDDDDTASESEEIKKQNKHSALERLNQIYTYISLESDRGEKFMVSMM